MIAVKPLIAVSAALALSVSLNLWQWNRLAASSEKRKGEIATAVADGKRLALEEQVKRERDIADLARIDETRLLTDLAEIAERAKRTEVVYRDRVRTLPAATCAPGRERVDAANALLLRTEEE